MAIRSFLHSRYVLLSALLVVLVSCVAYVWATRSVLSQTAAPSANALVNLSPWETAQALAAMTETAEEARLAREAEHLADHSVDQAFAAALRLATLHKPALSGNAIDLSRKVAGLEQVVAADKESVRALTQLNASGDLEIAKAQLGLDSDQLTEAQQDLARASGDIRPLIQQELAAHEASLRKYDAQSGMPNPTAANASQAHENVWGLANAWVKQRNRERLLRAAAADARRAVQELSGEHQHWEAQTSPMNRPVTQGDRLLRIGQQTARSQLLGIFDDRIVTERQLALLYVRWAEQVALQHRMTQHLLAELIAWIALIVIAVIALDAAARHFALQPAIDRRNTRTLTTVLRFAIYLVGAGIILVVVFGTPTQTPTIVGLTTAGLTVVLQDFIIAFFGWFVLIGRNGIRVGDWVEINGVAGEVMSLGLLRTILLEMDSQFSKGHPTGRRTTFINSFAIKGQYFNYSTSGQWTWDEIRIGVPPERDAYSTAEQIRKEVLEATANDSQKAQQEWKHVSQRFLAEPSVDLRPSASGIDLIIRYVTRASERFEMRNRLYERMIRLLHGMGNTQR